MSQTSQTRSTGLTGPSSEPSTLAGAPSNGRFGVIRTYEPYSDDPHYIEANRDFVKGLALDEEWTVLDLACGIGTLSRLALGFHPRLTVVGLDLSHEGLRVAKRRFEADTRERSKGGSREARVALLTATADVLPLADESVDAVMMGHSIHMLADERKLLGEIRRVARPGAPFAFNTSFFAGTFAPGTETIYHQWTMEALGFIRRRDEALRERGLPGVRRKKGSVPAAFSRPWLSREEWEERLEGAGFETAKVGIRTVPLTQRSFEAIGAYAGFAQVLLSGYPLELACEALEAAAEPTFAAAGVREVPRYWLEIVAIRK
jgi:ubiquinone/menaquinone biosynthesis C-methylase UbiE